MSPFWYADKIKDPILLMHGEVDDNTALPDSVGAALRGAQRSGRDRALRDAAERGTRLAARNAGCTCFARATELVSTST